ncbi:hypothetical protein [Methylobacterium sp. UNC378MF]|uniref:hypothetical protein n=1 Tax=Methylobacterium sp. UNC378MF TaxID=1502748 RepID=UPI001113D2FA|nr:hypothetical protein [Methylobacterium sp. UNC378MF]
MAGEKRPKSRQEASWLLIAIPLLIAIVGSFFTPESIKDFTGLLSVVIWPAALLIIMSWFRPEIGRIVGRVTEFDAFGVKAKIQAELIQSAQEAKDNPGSNKSPTENQVERANEVKQIVGSNTDILRAQIDDLAEEYQSLRASQPSGPDRTRKMEIVVAKMRTIGLAAYPLRYDLANSPSPGKRLQAIASLQVKTDYEMLDWLAKRVKEEKPFVSYHALVALNVAAKGNSANQHRETLVEALRVAESGSQRFGTDTDRHSMLEQFRHRVERL